MVPVRDGLPWLEDQLAALAGQRLPVGWEVVIADNGSTDGSVAVARRWAELHPEMRVVDASAVAGPAAARNAGVAAATSALLAFCDADDLVRPGWLAACVRALQEVDVAAGTFDVWTLDGRAAAEPTPAATRQLGFLPAGITANLAVRRSAFEAVGGFDEALRVGEDVDLCWRLQLAGYRFGVATDAVVARRPRAGVRQALAAGYAYGRSGVTLYRRYRHCGARPDVRGAARSWAALAAAVPSLVRPAERRSWAAAVGMRAGRIAGSVRHRVLFP